MLSADARALLARRLSGRASDQVGPERAVRPPLSPVQRRLWIVHQVSQGTLAYNVSAVHRLRGELDVDALRAAVTAVIDRHEVLRTHFAVDDEDQPYQVIGPVPAEPLAFHEVSGEAEAAELAAEMADTRFTLTEPPLLRTWLARLGDRDHVLGIVVHHTLFDRESLEVWEKELSEAYRAAELPALMAQYADFAQWQHQVCAAPAFAEHERYWAERLRSVPPVLALPTDRPHPDTPSCRAGEVTVTVPADVVAGLRATADRCGATMFMTGLAAFHGLLARYSGADEVVVGCPVNGRSRVQYEGLIGFFANSLPMSADLSDDPPFDEMVARVRAAVLDAHAHREVPFDDIVRAVSPPRLPGHNPIFQVWFDLIGAGPADGGLVLPGIATEPFDDSRARTRFDLELHMAETAAGELTGRLLYAVDLFDRSTAEEIAEHYQGFLRSAAQRPDTRLSEVDFFAADELAVILGDWGTARP